LRLTPGGVNGAGGGGPPAGAPPLLIIRASWADELANKRSRQVAAQYSILTGAIAAMARILSCLVAVRGDTVTITVGDLWDVN
jgi:hypothetical protein